MRRGWSSPARVVRELVFGPDGPGTAQATALELQLTHAPLAGEMGRPVFGMTGDPAFTCSAWIEDPQTFRGAAQMGATPTPPWAPPPALPSTEQPPALQDWLQTWTRDEGVLS
jgi:hypothetical protein